jgi:hypothetical protein
MERRQFVHAPGKISLNPAHHGLDAMRIEIRQPLE